MAVYDDGDGQVQADSADHLSAPDRITILMAGWVGAAVGGYPHPSSDDLKVVDDFRRARNIAIDIDASMLGTEDADADEAAIRTLLAEGRDNAREIIETHRARFYHVAEELFSRGELRASEIATLLP